MNNLTIADIIFVAYMAICCIVSIIFVVMRKRNMQTGRTTTLLAVLWGVFVIFAVIVMYLHGMRPNVIFLS